MTKGKVSIRLNEQVFFRKYTEDKAKSLGIVGWVENTKRGTVLGKAQGPKDAVAEFKQWLSNTGSPRSEITKAEFRNETSQAIKKFENFCVRK